MKWSGDTRPPGFLDLMVALGVLALCVVALVTVLS